MANKIEKQFLDTENKGPVRLNKYLSEAGVCSRREADKLIAAGQAGKVYFRYRKGECKWIIW